MIENHTVQTMGSIFAGIFGALFVTWQPLVRVAQGSCLPVPKTHPSKRAGEIFVLYYSICWILAVGVVIALQSFEQWDEWGYLAFCMCCAVPSMLIPTFLFPSTADKTNPWQSRYVTKANLWQAIFSFVGNYWYTHYFYRVLKADYTFPAHRLNDVPICLYFMTHAYFMFYHVLSNMALRYTRTSYKAGRARSVYEIVLVVVMSYTTAFMEAITICGFPYYRFEDVHMAYTIGSLYYAIYFLVSFPMFLRIDENPKKKFSLFQTAIEALGSSMLVLCLLDFVRLHLGVPLFSVS